MTRFCERIFGSTGRFQWKGSPRVWANAHRKQRTVMNRMAPTVAASRLYPFRWPNRMKAMVAESITSSTRELLQKEVNRPTTSASRNGPFRNRKNSTKIRRRKTATTAKTSQPKFSFHEAFA